MRLARIDEPEAALERLIRQFLDLARHFDTGRPGADDHERQQLPAACRVTGPLGLLEGAEDAAPQLERVVDRLHAGRELGEVVVAEVGLPRASRDDELVVRRAVVVPQQLRVNRLAGKVDVRDVAEQHLGVFLLAQDQPGGRRDLALGDDARRHLV